jgi:3'-5' exoribonuclease
MADAGDRITGAGAAPLRPGEAPVRIADLRPGMQARGVYVVKKRVGREQPGGGKFLLFQFADRSGQINGVLWEGADAVQQEIDTGDLAHVQGEVQLYQNARQIKVRRIERADPATCDVSQFVPTSAADLNRLYDRLLEFVDSLRDPHLARLAAALFRDPELRTRYQHAPAGKGWHHAYVGGLLEHVVCMLELGEVLVRQHPRLDRDLFVAGILFHDLGKVEEMALRVHVDYTLPGRLLGHLVQGCLLVGRAMDRIEGFPEELRARVLHVIVGHHGALERGSPRPPMTLEATAVHLLDHLDSQAHAVEQIVGRGADADGWTEHVKLLDRAFYVGRAAPPPEPGGGDGAAGG